MRCDRCPLCPSEDDVVCPISEGELGIEHKDGMWGCRHSWNWCKKRAEEYADNLRKIEVEDALLMKMLKDGNTQ